MADMDENFPFVISHVVMVAWNNLMEFPTGAEKRPSSLCNSGASCLCWLRAVDYELAVRHVFRAVSCRNDGGRSIRTVPLKRSIAKWLVRFE